MSHRPEDRPSSSHPGRASPSYRHRVGRYGADPIGSCPWWASQSPAQRPKPHRPGLAPVWRSGRILRQTRPKPWHWHQLSRLPYPGRTSVLVGGGAFPWLGRQSPGQGAPIGLFSQVSKHRVLGCSDTSTKSATPCFPRSQGPTPEDGLYILI